MSEDKDAKTEQPTGKRLAKAKSEGNIPVSQEVKSAAMLLGALIVVGVLSPWLGRNLLIFLRGFLERPETMAVDIESIRAFFIQTIWRVAVLLAFPVLVLMITGLAGTIGQIGLVYTPKKLAFNLGNLNPLNGLKRLFSTGSVVELGKSLVKLVVVSTMI